MFNRTRGTIQRLKVKETMEVMADSRDTTEASTQELVISKPSSSPQGSQAAANSGEDTTTTVSEAELELNNSLRLL